MELFTIGHSIHPIKRFIELLTMHGITALCDVRSSPYSRFTPQFNREALKDELAKHHIAYIYLGSELGPRSSDQNCYKNGKVQYDLLARTDLFQQGLSRLRKGMTTYRIALMCAEKDPIVCHRMILICRHLRAGGILIGHILEDSTIEDNRDAETRLLELLKISPEDLFSTTAEQIARAYDLQGEKIAYMLQEEQGNHDSY
ncbi:MAG: DUF488 domain-containing protein [Deltaproteobacteria bacterium]|nr:DUF488 domain-containing protein [Deltaproteobacteria bacterium]